MFVFVAECPERPVTSGSDGAVQTYYRSPEWTHLHLPPSLPSTHPNVRAIRFEHTDIHGNDIFRNSIQNFTSRSYRPNPGTRPAPDSFGHYGDPHHTPNGSWRTMTMTQKEHTHTHIPHNLPFPSTPQREPSGGKMARTGEGSHTHIFCRWHKVRFDSLCCPNSTATNPDAHTSSEQIISQEGTGRGVRGSGRCEHTVGNGIGMALAATW